MNADVQYIDTEKALKHFVSLLTDTPWLAVDTEFLRESTYRPQLCLIQIAAPNLIACIDPLALADLGPLREKLYEHHTTKILHAARQDIEVLYQLWGEIPTPVFDTQIAAALLGENDQIGYANLVGKLLGVTLEKGHTRTDWSQRPLEPAQIQYAVDDVRYLGDLYIRQHKALSEAGRLDWLNEITRKLETPHTYASEPEIAWSRVKGINHLQSEQLNIVKVLAAWREKRAIKKNRPRRWILADDVMVNIAVHAPKTHDQLQQICSIPKRLIHQDGTTILNLVKQARQEPASSHPVASKHSPLSKEQSKLVTQLTTALKHEANQHHIAPSILGTRREIERLVRGETDLPLLRGWRSQLIGQKLQKMANTQTAVPSASQPKQPQSQ
ncbi:ribonuclease D [Acidihalobacter prosperus]